MSVERNAPEIRFKGFSEEWIESHLGELIDIRSAARVHKEQWTKAGVPFFRTSDVVSIYKGNTNTKAYISQEVYQGLSEKIGKVVKDDLLITGGGSIGIPYLVPDDEPLYFKDADLLWLKNNNKFNGDFLYTFFFSAIFKKHIKSISHIGTIAHYTIEQAKATPINTCDDKEQTQIGNTFQKLDSLINQHQQKYDKLSNIKKSMLAKMYPKQGEKIPEIRFKGFNGEWEEKPLKKVANDITDGNWIESEHIFESGEFRIIQTGNIGIGQYLDRSKHAKFFHQLNFDAVRGNEIYPGDILISRLAEPAGRAAILPDTGYRMVTAVDVAIVRPVPGFDSYFLMTLLNMDQTLSAVGEWVSGTSHKRISLANLVKMGIIIPCVEEQTAIGIYFQKLDTLINQQQQQITKLNNIKQACLRKMFV